MSEIESLAKGKRYRIFRRVLAPGARLKREHHMHRSETLIVVSGTMSIILNNLPLTKFENESIHIPATVDHEIGNPGRIPAEIVEIWYGSYLGEDDAVR